VKTDPYQRWFDRLAVPSANATNVATPLGYVVSIMTPKTFGNRSVGSIPNSEASACRARSRNSTVGFPSGRSSHFRRRNIPLQHDARRLALDPLRNAECRACPVTTSRSQRERTTSDHTLSLAMLGTDIRVPPPPALPRGPDDTPSVEYLTDTSHCTSCRSRAARPSPPISAGAPDRHFGDGLACVVAGTFVDARLVVIEGGKSGPGADAGLVQIAERPEVA